MDIYHYHSETGEFLQQGVAILDPLDKEPLIPANSTSSEPPLSAANEVAVWESGAWVLKPDYRGYVGYNSAGDKQSINDIGIEPDVSWQLVRPFILSESKEIKHDEIRTAFNTAALLPVTDANSRVWSGGFDSALKMDAAKRMAEIAGLTTVSLFDDANIEHVLSIAEADAVILILGADYQTKFAQKQALMTAVDALPDTAVQADVDAIVVTF